MKLQQLLIEALGIPSNLIETNRIIFGKFKDTFEYHIDSRGLGPKNINRVNEETFSVIGYFQVADFNFNKVNITVSVSPSPNLERKEVETLGLGFSFEGVLDSTSHKRLIKPKPRRTSEGWVYTEIMFGINLAANEETSWNDVYDHIFLADEKDMITSMAHELKHAYDWYKRGDKGEKIASRLKYNVASMAMGLPPIDEFNYYIYYTADLENLVRPSELAANLEYDGVTKDSFLDSLRQTRVYTYLKEVENYSYEKLRDNIKNDPRAIDAIVKFLNANLNMNTNNMSEDEIVDEMLKINYDRVAELKMNEFGQLLTRDIDPIALMFGKAEPSQAQKDAYDEIKTEVEAFKNNPLDFYKYEVKKMKQATQKILKKLAKVYAYLPDTPKSPKSRFGEPNK
jgi:hypothetical protein